MLPSELMMKKLSITGSASLLDIALGILKFSANQLLKPSTPSLGVATAFFALADLSSP
ncbi:hypothetical protein D3C73_911860 [compost metagenome]